MAWVDIANGESGASVRAKLNALGQGIGSGLFPDGSAATPAFRFSGDEDTGIYRPAANAIALATAGVDRFRIENGNIGFRTAPTSLYNLEFAGSARFTNNTAGQTAAEFYNTNTDGFGAYIQGALGSRYALKVLSATGTPLMDVLGNGNVGIGTAFPVRSLSIRGAISNTYVQISSPDTRSYLVGAELTGFGIYDETADAYLWRFDHSRHMQAGSDNVQTLGTASKRWSTVFAGTGTINTSDEREKHWRGELNAAELRAAKRIIGELGIYQWNDAVAEKGEDKARLHTGVRAQRCFQIMEDEGLDWRRYAWACYDKWEQQTEPVMEEVTITKTRKVMRPSTLIDPATGQPALVETEESYEETEMQPTGETRVILEAGDRYGIRPDQLLFWLIAAQEQRIAALEA